MSTFPRHWIPLACALLLGWAPNTEGRQPGPAGQQCLDQGIPPGEVCPPIIGLGVVADPGFWVGSTGPTSSSPNIPHPVGCGWGIDYRDNDPYFREVHFGTYIGGCEVGACESDPACSPSLALKLAQIGTTCEPFRWDGEGNLDGFEVLSCTKRPTGGVLASFRATYTLWPGEGALIDPGLDIRIVHQWGYKVYDSGGVDPIYPSRDQPHDTGVVVVPTGTSYAQLTITDEACSGDSPFPFQIGETENYQIVVSPGTPWTLTLRPFYSSEVIQVISCPLP